MQECEENKNKHLNTILYFMNYFTSQHKQVVLGKELARGGEGVVYDLDDTLVTKIFYEPYSNNRFEKIRCFISKGIKHKNVCTPLELVYDEQGKFAGYIMTKATGAVLKLSILQPQLFREKFPNWTRVELTQLALNILHTIEYLHSKNVLIGDINPFNINIENYDSFYFLDSDSFQIDDYPCPVGTVDFTAPEIQGQNFGNFLRSKNNEYFAVAVLLFELYIPGKHPYSRTGGSTLSENIKNHEFVFPLGDNDMNATPKGQWEAIWYNLPYEIRKFFFEVFKEDKRHTISEWIAVLEQYLSQLNDNLYSRAIFPLSSESLSKDKTLNMNRRNITDKDVNLRNIETVLRRTTITGKIAVLELSTKAVKLLIGHNPDEIKSNPFNFKMFLREAVKTDTGRGLDSRNIMDMTYFRERVLPVIQTYRRVAEQHGVEKLYTVATAAYRTANNRDEILDCIRNEANINVCILKKEEEALATIKAFQFSTRDKDYILGHKYVLVIDQGGGSTEVTLFKDQKAIKPFSMNLGTEVLRTILFKESNEQTTLRQALANADKLIRDRLDTLYNNIIDDFPIDNDIACIAVGTAITKATGEKSNPKQHDTVLTIEKLSSKVKTLDEQLKSKFEYTRELYYSIKNKSRYSDSLDGDIVMRLGIPMFIAIMKKLGIPSLKVSGTGLWYGIYFQQLLNV